MPATIQVNMVQQIEEPLVRSSQFEWNYNPNQKAEADANVKEQAIVTQWIQVVFRPVMGLEADWPADMGKNTAMASEPALARIWNTPEEDVAWANL